MASACVSFRAVSFARGVLLEYTRVHNDRYAPEFHPCGGTDYLLFAFGDYVHVYPANSLLTVGGQLHRGAGYVCPRVVSRSRPAPVLLIHCRGDLLRRWLA